VTGTRKFDHITPVLHQLCWLPVRQGLKESPSSWLSSLSPSRRKSCYAQHLLKSLHWLPISQRINFKLATLAFKTQSTSQPEYLHQLISSQHSGSSMTLRSSTRPLGLLQVPCTRTVYGSRAFSSAVPASLSWTIFQPQSLKQTVCLFSVADSRHICSLLPLKTVVNCNVASASVDLSVHTCSFMALYKFVFNFNFTSSAFVGRPHGTASPSNCGLHHCLLRRLRKKTQKSFIRLLALLKSEDFCLTGAI